MYLIFANIWFIRCISVFVSVSFRLSSTQLRTPIRALKGYIMEVSKIFTPKSD